MLPKVETPNKGGQQILSQDTAYFSVVPPPTGAQEACVLANGLREGEVLWSLEGMGSSDFMRPLEIGYL